MRNYRKYTDEEVINNAKNVKSIAGLLKKLGLSAAGGNYANIKKKLQELNIDCAHWTGQGWNKGNRSKDWSDYKLSNSVKLHLIEDQGHKCEQCDLTEWQGSLIPLEIDHIDGDRTNNNKENLKLLCCNCHALTPTWRGRNCRKEKKQRKCSVCSKNIGYYSNKTGKCSSCHNKTRSRKNDYRKVKNRPPVEQLIHEVKETSYYAVGRKYGVSDTCIRRWINI